MGKILRVILCLFFGALAIFSGYQLFSELSEYRAGEESYEQLTQFVTFLEQEEEETDREDAAISAGDAPALEQETEEDGIRWPKVDFDSLERLNPDVVGWIYMEGTNVNYPIVQAEDNDYYLKHLFDGTRNKSGSIFMDFRNEANFADANTVIHGHHMRDDSMFADITKYKEQEFYDEYPTYLLMTPEGNYQVEIVAGYVASLDDRAWELGFDSEEDLQGWIDYTLRKSCFDSDVIPTVEDKFITLSTCSYEFDDARFVLVGVLR